MKNSVLNPGFPPGLFLTCLVTLLLCSCMNSNVSDLQQYVHKERAKAPAKIPPLPEVKQYATYAYDDTSLRNPFIAQNRGTTSSIEDCPQVTRANKDALEMVPLDSLTMVGSLEQEGQRWALIKDSEGIVRRAKKGDHVGQNNGLIIAVAENDVIIEELVSDRMQGCLKRQVVLAASEL